MTGREIAILLETVRVQERTEEGLQEAVAAALRKAGVRFREQVAISDSDRLDFLIGHCALELKIKGSASDLIRQLHRYAKQAGIDELVVVTTRMTLTRVPGVLLGKPVSVALLLGGSL